MINNGRLGGRVNFHRCLNVLAAICLAYAAYIALRYAGQPLLDQYSFRQTQTALTSFWMMKEGFKLAYETPVAGMPWSIPFEFPLYQAIVAFVSQATSWPLTAVGRVVSFVFLVCCLFPARSIIRLLRLDDGTFPLFTALLLSSPLYLYWGRTFMIETASVFFAVVAIRYFIELLHGSGTNFKKAMFLGFMSLSILQKATTGLPVLAVLGMLLVISGLKEYWGWSSEASKRKAVLLSRIGLAVLYIGVPLVIGVLWTMYTDRIKAENPLGSQLTSTSLAKWNWGTLKQRVSFPLYGGVFWSRMFVQNLSGLLGGAVLLMFFASRQQMRIKGVVAIALLMGFLPPLIFSNLHIVHTYYQSSNLIFAIFGLAVCCAALSRALGGGAPLLSLAVLMVCSNLYWFSTAQKDVVKQKFFVESTRELAIAEVLNRELAPTKGFVAFGEDWNSALAFFSERKSFTVPGFIRGYKENSGNPSNYMGDEKLGAVVLCPTVGYPTLESLVTWAASRKHWKIGETHGCYIALPERAPLDGVFVNAAIHQCEGSLDQALLIPVTDQKILSVSGWLRQTEGTSGSEAHLFFEQHGSPTAYFEVLRSYRPDVNAALKDSTRSYHGFSRAVDAGTLHGTYRIGLIRRVGDRLERCQLAKDVRLP